ncbi:MAG TPA: peptide-methionine (S)-S-oxide reductase MsrA [Allosphingosinicella sp.]|nr:peptide-methionine (S)-S-oxide reductase MsrA [Allosphingosinicella sp.]
MRPAVTAMLAGLLVACGSQNASADQATGARPAKVESAVFAGGCFWCTEADFEKVPGVISAVSGYTGGRTENPTYQQVTKDDTGHYEAVRVEYDPAKVSYQQLARHYFRTVDPLDAGGQFCDRGESYRTAIFVKGAEQKRLADAAKADAERTLGKKVVTPVLAAGRFWFAEGYHQDYYKKNPVRYRYYRGGCGRDARLKEVWGGR